MSSNVVNQVAFLRSSREFPTETESLSQEVEKTYIDIANVVNVRTIGIFTVNKPAITGENWYLFQNKRQQSLRQVYTQTVVPPAAPVSINHGINLNLIDGFTRLFGTYTDGTNWYGLIAGSNVAIAGQISFYITPGATPTTGQIVFLVGAGAPAVTKLRVILEWLSMP